MTAQSFVLHIVLLVIFFVGVQPYMPSAAQTSARMSRSSFYVVPLQTNEETPPTVQKKEDNSSSSFPVQLLDWNASGSIGSLLMQMQRREEEIRKLNKTLLDKDQAVDLSRHNSTKNSSKLDEFIQETKGKHKNDMDVMDKSKARELDEAITLRISSSPGKDVQILELPDACRVLQELPDYTSDELVGSDDESSSTGTAAESDDTSTKRSVEKIKLPSLSKASHYDELIGRDMRQLAVSIASCIDDTPEFQAYCQQVRGGIYPLIECIREGADAIRQRGKSTNRRSSPSGSSYVLPDFVVSSQYEVRFLAASSACRALRDLCGLSSDVAAIVTDTLLRANANKHESNLMKDLVTILEFAHDADIKISTRARKRDLLWLRRRNEPSKWKLNFSQNRNGTFHAPIHCLLFDILCPYSPPHPPSCRGTATV